MTQSGHDACANNIAARNYRGTGVAHVYDLSVWTKIKTIAPLCYLRHMLDFKLGEMLVCPQVDEVPIPPTPAFNCRYPVLEWIAEHVPAAPVNVMAQFHPDNFCDPASAKYRDKYAEIARRPSSTELNNSWRRASELGLKFETTTFERCDTV